MNWILAVAMYFVLWWLVLFVTLPLGARSHEEENDVTLGTTASAPHRPRLLMKILLTTAITTVLMAVYYVVTHVYGYSFEDIPNFVPQ